MSRYVLTTDVMEAQFGPVEAEVVSQDEHNREVIVRVSETGQVLEYARVRFKSPGVEAYPEVDRSIRAGALMGKEFRNAGIAFRRRQGPPVRRKLSARLQTLFGTDEPYGLGIMASILVGPDELSYAENYETYSPAIEWPPEFVRG
jgi:hypothetical protein